MAPVYANLVDAATANASLHEIQRLLAQGCDANAVDAVGRTALHVAAHHNNLDLVKSMVDAGLSVQKGDARGYTPLHCAAKIGNVEMINFLVDKGADVRAMSERQVSILHSAVRSGQVNVVERVLDLGLAATLVDEDHGSVLHYAAEYGAVPVMRLLVTRGAAVDARTKNGHTILHSAVKQGQVDALRYALELAINVNGSGKADWETPLYLTTQLDDHKTALQLTRVLCAHDAEWTPACQQHFEESATEEANNKGSLWRAGLVTCISHWVAAHQADSQALTEIPFEIIERGADSTKTYVNDVAESNADDLVYRCKVCVLGPNGWGKTSLIRSLQAMQPTLTNEQEGQTEGIELLSSDIVDQREGKPPRRLELTYWDFPGRDVHQLVHSLFFSRRTLFVVTVDVTAYLNQLDIADRLSDDQFEYTMDRFVNTHVFRWLRTILSQQPDAHILLAGTKEDALDTAKRAREVWVDLKDRLADWKQAYIQELQEQLHLASSGEHHLIHRTSSFLLDQEDHGAEVMEKLKAKLAGVGEWLLVCSADAESIRGAREKVLECLADAELGFQMGKMYKQVYEAIKQRRVKAKAAGSEREYLDHAIVRLSALRRQLMREVDELGRDECELIIRALDDLGDVLWFEHEDAGELNDYVILDPKLGIDIVSEVINHDFSKDPLGPPQDGLLPHARLQTFPLWRAMDVVLMHSFKSLLQFFHLAFTAGHEEILPESDLIVPAYWKAYPSASSRLLIRQQSKLDEIAKNRWCWEYEIPAGVADTIFEQLAVQTSTSYLKRAISANCVECACDEFASRITLIEGEGKNDIICVEVAGEGAEMSWHNMRFYLMKMEKVLEMYPGMSTRRYIVDVMRGKFMGDRHALEPAVKKLEDAISLGRDEKSLRSEMRWFPEDMNWYIRKSWKDIGGFQQLQLDQLILSKLEVLRTLAIAGDMPRRYPALWSFEYRPLERKVILRMSSDLSGHCFHRAIEIEANPLFLAKYGSIIKEGLTVCSGIVASAIPLPFIQNVIDAAMSVYDTKVEETKKVHNLIDRLDMNESNQFDSQTTAMSPGASMAVLRDILKFYNDSFDELEISDLSNLQLAVTATGEYVWAHAHEITMLKDKITPCSQPPSTWADMDEFNANLSQPTGSPVSPMTTKHSIVISFCISSITGLTPSDWSRAYCKWQISYGNNVAPLASGATGQYTDDGSPPSWSNMKIVLDTIPSIEMLRNCRLLVRVKRRTKIGWTKVFGGSEIQLRDYIDEHAVHQFHCDPIDIAIDDATPPKQWATVEFFVDAKN